jgi:Ca2+-binding EF-hand superfamily protein
MCRIPLIAVAVVLLATSAVAQTPPSGELEERFRRADRDGDGKLSPAEAQAASWFVGEMQRFEGIDRDHSGTVTLVEVGQAVAAQVAGWLGADRDKDGRVTEAEAREQRGFDDTFERADADGDRVVTRSELERLSQRSYYRDSELPAVAPNIIEKRF